MRARFFTFRKRVVSIILLSMLVTLHIKGQDRLPDGWQGIDIGEVKLPSRVFYNAEDEVFDIEAAGHEYWGSGGDHGHFLYFETEEDKEIVLRVREFSAQTRNGKVLINMRTGLDSRSSNMVVEFKRNEDFNPWVYSCVFYYRLLDNGSNGGDNAVDIPQMEQPLPRWLRLVRQGSYITAYHAEDADPERLVWRQLGTPTRFVFRGPAYMGIAVCGGGSGDYYARAIVDNLQVRDVENPYYVQEPVSAQTLTEGSSADINVTAVFGHYQGDYWTIEPSSTDTNVATVSFWEEEYPNEEDRILGERYQKYIRVNAHKDGIATVRMTTNVMGFKMESDFIVTVNGLREPEIIASMNPPEPWTLTELQAPNVTRSMMEYNGSIHENLTLWTERRAENMGNSSFFLHRNVDENADVEMKMYVESVRNTGNGSFAGFLIRESLANNVPFVSLGVGAYEGLQLRYRWDRNVTVISRTLPDVIFPCWIALQKYTTDFGSQYINVYYSYDNKNWRELLNYPLLANFLGGNDMQYGVALAGGSHATADRKASAVLNNFALKINEPFEDFSVIGSFDEIKARLSINPNTINLGTSATISYKVIISGRVTMTVFDSMGRLMQTLVNANQEAGEYTLAYTPNNLHPGVYLLRYVAEGDYQFVRFVIP